LLIELSVATCWLISLISSKGAEWPVIFAAHVDEGDGGAD
jgi:hypothetical protein